MSWWYNRNRGRTLENRPSIRFVISGEDRCWSVGNRKQGAPFAPVVNHKLEDAVSIWGSEGNRVLSRGVWDGGKRNSDVGIQHGEFQLKVQDARVWDP
jgi:hypothetical protein